MAGKGSLYVFYCFSYAFRVRWGGIRPSRSGKTKTIADTISMYSISWVGNTTHGMKCMSSYKRGSRVRCTEERSMQRSRKGKQGRVWRARIKPRPEWLFSSFYHDLEGHILSRLTGRDYDGMEHDFTTEERRSIRIEHNRLYKHKVIRVHYTTYDMRRSTDSINPSNPEHANIMLYGTNREFWYARVLGIFHLNVRLSSSEEFQRLDIIWVRWYGNDTTWNSGFSAKRRLGFIPHNDIAPFGFIDPNDVIRGIHLIPAFDHGRTDFYLPRSRAARCPSEQHEDWTYHYVN